MSLIDTYRNNVKRKHDALMKFYDDKAKISEKISKEKKKIVNAKAAIARTKSQSIIKSRTAEITRSEKNVSDLDKTLASLEKKIAKAEKELSNEQRKLDREEKKSHDKRIKAENEEQKRTREKINDLNRTIQNHELQQAEIMAEIQTIKKPPEHITVLFLASNPIDTQSLRLDAEAREIQEMIRKSKYRDTISFESRWAVRTADILQAINEVNPEIIHFSGHGMPNGDLAFENSNGECKPVTKEAMVQTIGTLTDRVRFMFFNACFSASQAEKITEIIDAAIGMNTSIGDEAAKVFAAQFYSSIGFGHDIETAFNQAKAALMLEGIAEEDTPELYVNPTIEPSKLVLVAK